MKQLCFSSTNGMSFRANDSYRSRDIRQHGENRILQIVRNSVSAFQKKGGEKKTDTKPTRGSRGSCALSFSSLREFSRSLSVHFRQSGAEFLDAVSRAVVALYNEYRLARTRRRRSVITQERRRAGKAREGKRGETISVIFRKMAGQRR